MDSLATLHTVLEHARHQRDLAQAAMQQAQAAAAAARAQSEQLDGYRQEYRQRWSTRLREPSPVALLQHVQAFSGRLDHAIDLQAASVRQSEQRVSQARDRLLACEQRLAAVGKLIERRQAQLQRAADRREQKALDEAAARSQALARERFPLS